MFNKCSVPGDRNSKKEIQLIAVVNDRNQLSNWQWPHAQHVLPLQQSFLATAADAKMSACAKEDGTDSSKTDTSVLGTWSYLQLLLVVIARQAADADASPCHLSLKNKIALLTKTF